MSTLKPRTATIPIYQGDDSERLAELRMAVAIAERQAMQTSNGPRRRGDDVPDDDVKAAQDAYDALVDEAAERAVEVIVRAIGRRRFRDLVKNHPPREVDGKDGKKVTHEDDVEYGVNVETFAPALLTFVDLDDVDDEGEPVRTIMTPKFDTPRKLEKFLDDDLTDGDYEKVFATAYWINRAPGSDPKELRYSPSISATSE